MKKYAFFLLVLSILVVVVVTLMFFIDFKYDPGTKMKVIIIGLYSFLGVKSYNWIKMISKEKKSSIKSIEDNKND